MGGDDVQDEAGVDAGPDLKKETFCQRRKLYIVVYYRGLAKALS